MEFQVGGGGVNTAVSFSRLGFKTAYIGKIGYDYNGLQIYNHLKKEKIDFLGGIGKQSGFSVILDSKHEDRTILNSKGCSDDLKLKDVTLKPTKWFYVSSMMKQSFKTTISILKKSKSKVAYNPSLYQAKLGYKKLKPMLDQVDILIFNKEEAQALSNEQDLNKAFKKLINWVKQAVLITDGKNGACFYDGKIFFHAKPKKNIKIVETTGAGDSFASGFVAGIASNKSIEDSLKMGLLNAESVIQNYGAQNILLSKTKMMQKLKNDKRKITKEKRCLL